MRSCRRLGWFMAAVTAAAVVLGQARGGSPESPDDVASACLNEMFALRNAAVADVQAELAAFDAAMDALPSEAGGMEAARLAAATSARLDKTGLKAIAAINRAAGRGIARLNRIGADVSYINGTDAQRLSIVTILSDSLRFSAQASVADDMVAFMEQ